MRPIALGLMLVSAACDGSESCVQDELCTLDLDAPSDGEECLIDPSQRFATPITDYGDEGARCILRALRDRTDGVLVYRYSCGIESLTVGLKIAGENIGAKEFYDDGFEDGDVYTERYAGRLRSRVFYEDCLDLPTDELHTCFAKLYEETDGCNVDCCYPTGDF